MENWPIKKNDRERIELPGDWQHYDRHLYKLAQETGFGTVNRLLRHVANELSGIRTPADFYLACAILHGYRPAPKRRNPKNHTP